MNRWLKIFPFLEVPLECVVTGIVGQHLKQVVKTVEYKAVVSFILTRDRLGLTAC